MVLTCDTRTQREAEEVRLLLNRALIVASNAEAVVEGRELNQRHRLHLAAEKGRLMRGGADLSGSKRRLNASYLISCA